MARRISKGDKYFVFLLIIIFFIVLIIKLFYSFVEFIFEKLSFIEEYLQAKFNFEINPVYLLIFLFIVGLVFAIFVRYLKSRKLKKIHNLQKQIIKEQEEERVLIEIEQNRIIQEERIRKLKEEEKERLKKLKKEEELKRKLEEKRKLEVQRKKEQEEKQKELERIKREQEEAEKERIKRKREEWEKKEKERLEKEYQYGYRDDMNGYEYETYCADLFKYFSWDAKTTKKSGDFGADVIAEKNGIKIVAQCKKWNGKVGYSAVKEIFTAKEINKADYALVITNSDFTKSAYKGAQKTDVILTRHAELKSCLEEIISKKNKKL